ncbi:AraC family transcriptional regulator [Streptomyces sp. SID12501]|uniref:AraC family transcriptional regulator n=1 Tax=Streptomyces sp. SID12501 TaxID=2706042 RepID=A0A6B3C706_9ACTN|nr:AraC family transcriptional regulator [Streptomyces sp. SID12501]
MSAPSVISRATTEHIAPAERIHYWEDYNRRALVGLSCTSYSEQGLLASQTNIELGALRLADISGNAHAIERSPQTVRSAPKDSVFATLLLKGEAVFLHENGCLAATAGELFLYDTRRPYLFGFSSSIRQILVDVPRDLFMQAGVGDGLPGPMLLGRGTAREGALVAALSSRLTGLTAPRGGAYGPADAVEGAVLDLLRQLAEERTGGRPGPDAYRSQLIVADDYIDRHLHDPRLSEPFRVR